MVMNKPFEWSAFDRRFLRGLRISPDAICATCDGKGYVNDHVGCRDCNKTGRRTTDPPQVEEDGA